LSPDFKIKKAAIIFLAAISAILLTELAVRYILGFPTYGVEKKLLGIKSSTATSNIFYPHSKYYNVEDGYKVYKRNNLGLYGKDVSWNKNDTLVYVLGSSYLEAAQTPPDSMAVTHFQKLIDEAGAPYKVINLGRSGHDPYDLYFRLSWFERQFGCGKVILVLEDDYQEWLERHKHPLSSNLSGVFGKEVNYLSSRIAVTLQNISSIAYLFRNTIKNGNIEENEFLKYHEEDKSDLSNDLASCLLIYKNKYGNSFHLLSITDNERLNESLKQFSKTSMICFHQKEINIPEFKIKGVGHLNSRGNEVLGKSLYECIRKSYN